MDHFLNLATSKPVKKLAWTLSALLLVGLFLETWRYSVKPSPAENDQFIASSLQNASRLFHQKQDGVFNSSKQLSRTLQEQLEHRHNRRSLYNTLKQYASFWGISLVKNDSLFLWSGYAEQGPTPTEATADDSSRAGRLRIKKQNNVIYWQFTSQFTVREDTNAIATYKLFTRSKIEQNNPLPIGRDSEFNLLDDYTGEIYYPVTLTFFNPLPLSTVDYRPLVNTREDSVGAAYISSDQLDEALSSWSDTTRLWRTLFMLFCFICLSTLLYIWFGQFPGYYALASQLGVLAAAGLAFSYLDLSSHWLSYEADPDTVDLYMALTSYAIKTLFLCLIAFTVRRHLRNYRFELEQYWYPATISISALTGLFNAVVILYVFNTSFHTAAESNLVLLDLQILPDSGTLLFYLLLGLMLFSTALLLFALNRLLLRSGTGQQKLIGAIVTTGFFLALIVAQPLVPEAIRLNWAIPASALFFAFIYGTASLYVNNVNWIFQLSALRSLVIITALLALVGTVISYNSYLTRQDRILQERAASFAEDRDPYARKLIRKALTTLEQQISGISGDDLQRRIPYLQAEFASTIRNMITEEMQDYSIDLQLMDADGNLVASYSTSLKSPEWVQAYDVSRLALVTEIEQITRTNVRPIIQQPQLINKEDYSTFYRGWIPLFARSAAVEQPVGWILGSVYRERPNFNKPIRAVMAALNYEDWSNSYLLQKYDNHRLTGSYKQGITGYFPRYNELQQAEIEALRHDSLFYYNSEEMGYSYRNMVWDIEKDDDNVVKISTIVPGYRNVLYSYFRLNFIYLIVSALIASLLHLTRLKKINLFGKNERFRNRILDNFLFATLIFLLLLVLTTHYAITQQNKEIVRQDLFSKLESLAGSAHKSIISSRQPAGRSFSLDSLASPLNVDATFYRDMVVSTSTTPQIYQQHLLPEVLPYPAYNDLFLKKQRDALKQVALGRQQLLIGYRSVLSAENKPVAAVAIPTFLQSPKYDQQLLETTSYLIIFYLLVFGLFIIGTVLISRQLTKPIRFIQQGLNKISQGNLDVTIPVTSNDELGNLARAYNQMVRRLKELQKELAIAEREAAWKEMAQQVAHEIKNPLTPMKLNVQHLERQLSSDNLEPGELKKKIKKITKNLIDQIQSLNNIASDFSKFSQPIEEEFRDVEMNELINSVKELYLHDEKVHIKTDLQDRSIIVRGARDELKRVIINLIKNSFEAMPDGGDIYIRCYIKDDSAFVEVEDDGIGIPEEDKSRIFVPNFSTKSSGTGLGLAICKKVIEAHEGSISFASIEGKGTTFIIKLPLLKKEGGQ